MESWTRRRWPQQPGRRESVIRRAIARKASAPATPRPQCLQRPVGGRVSSGFGHRLGRWHAGVDYAVSAGTPVRAAAPGVVVLSRRLGDYGRLVVVDHGEGLATLYAHLDESLVRRGSLIGALAVVGLVGSTGRTTGPHLHFEVRENSIAVDPVHFFCGDD